MRRVLVDHARRQRFFGGLSVEEAAEAMQISTTTAERDWRLARAWLYRHLTTGGDGDRP